MHAKFQLGFQTNLNIEPATTFLNRRDFMSFKVGKPDKNSVLLRDYIPSSAK